MNLVVLKFFRRRAGSKRLVEMFFLAARDYQQSMQSATTVLGSTKAHVLLRFSPISCSSAAGEMEACGNALQYRYCCHSYKSVFPYRAMSRLQETVLL